MSSYHIFDEFIKIIFTDHGFLCGVTRYLKT